jgi:hypothetical protein
MAQCELTISVEGVSPLLMHNGQLANPLNPLVKEMKQHTGQRKKTDETYEEISRLEFKAGLYLNENGDVIIPSEVIESCLVDGAKKSKLGKQFKSAICVTDAVLLQYGPPKTVDEMWADPAKFVDVRACKVGQARVMRTRPIFRNWGITFEVLYDSEQVNEENILRAVEDAGRQVGMCDFRPKFGRFQIVT